MNILDSSAWLAIFTDGQNAKKFTRPLENATKLLVPSIVIYEVFKRILQEKNEETALRYIANMKQGIVVELDMDIALHAAKISRSLNLAMADSIILATAQQYNATVWTQDRDFKGISGVKYFKKN
ncbi:type II toxin-antitoxin system VapC family toxin [Candidatus Peregrinibacteria bacterium]|nr:type II toxin-antitoxin system VapC family toxin [Candidatus Peregrinibacteria bacterium]